MQESELAIKLYERFQGLAKEDYDLKLISGQTYKAVLFLVETSLSTLYHSMNEVDQAVKHRQKAEELQDQIEPDDVYELFVSLGYEIEKEQLMQTAEEIFKEKEESPAASFNEEYALSFLVDFAMALEKMEQEFAALSKNTDAKEYLEQFKNKARRITSRENPDREIDMLALCRIISDTAGFFLNTKHDRKTALELILLAIEIMDQWTKDYPDNLLNSVGTNIILKCLWDGAQIYLDNHKAQKALDFCERGLQLALSLAEEDELLNAEPLEALTKIKKEAQKRLKA